MKQTFEGKIGRTLEDSEAWFPEPPHPGEDAPNVIFVLLDDTGFAQFGCYGSEIDTENVNSLAQNGLQFTNFHVTPLCSPTRASLLTGRSQHAVGMRGVSNWQSGFPHQLGHISNHAGTIAEVLSSKGYATFCTGKWHLAPMEDTSAAGPFDQWPVQRGFDRFYGFLEGETDQFHPELTVDNHYIDPPKSPEEGYHLSEDLVDQLLRMISDSKGIRPDRPFFAYLPFGATHAPHQAPPKYLEKYRGAFDEGWDVMRERCYQKQIELGVIPEGTQLAPRNPGVDAWEDLPENQQKLAARLQEAFAAFLDHTDDQIGKLVDGLSAMGQLDNTILLVLADNGASQEGGPFGVMHEMKFFNGILESPDEAIERIDDIGGPRSHTNYPWGWAQCGNSPFKWYKQNTHEGGVHVPLVFHWPKGLNEDQAGSLRNQFVNVSDIVPTIYELIGISAPEQIKGFDQMPITGHSFVNILADSEAPATNTLQYFEQNGSRALVAGEWKAVCKHEPGADFDTEPWELYHLADDMSECVNLADEQPEKLDELIEFWWSEAERNGVLPIDERGLELFGARFRDRSPHPANRRYVYRPPMSPVTAQASAAVGGRSWELTARISSDASSEGVLWATGNINSGMSIFIQNNRLVVDYNAFDDHTIVESEMEIPEGDSILTVTFRRGEGRAGSFELKVNDTPSGRADLPLYMRMVSSIGQSIGSDHGSQVSTRYSGAFPFTGTLHEIVIQLLSRGAPGTKEAIARTENARQ
jgi:arylsulfatase A-like enzyme|tara:strand:+ start:663 stop:2921 length:2259 start_codon:yes stop_codon:yes gene_type:complete